MRLYHHCIGVCTYIKEYISERDLLRWISWYRRRGASLFYLYVSKQAEADTKKALGFESSCRTVSIRTAEDVLAAYNDCLRRAKYVCEFVMFLNVGEYLQPKSGNIENTIRKGIAGSNNCAGLYIDFKDYPRCILRPQTVRSFLHLNELRPYHKIWSFVETEDFFLAQPALRIAMMTHVLAKNGAPLALLSAAKVLKKAGYEVDVFSSFHGPLEESFSRLGIDVSIDPLLHGTPIPEQPWYGYYDLVFANTAVMAGCFTRQLDKAPAVWWLHEGPYVLEKCCLNEKNLSVLCPDRVVTASVSNIAREAFLALRPNWPITTKNLMVGVEDICHGEGIGGESACPMIFLMVGNIEENKGQDILLEAIGKISDSDRKKCEFWFVGKNGRDTSLAYLKNIEAMFSRFPEAKRLEPMPQEYLMPLYKKANAVIVPSREESLSMVAIEAMMSGTPCILSDNVGVSKYVKNKKDSFVFRSGDSDKLAEILHGIIGKRELLENMGRQCRHLYKKEFSFKKFEKNLLELVSRGLGV